VLRSNGTSCSGAAIQRDVILTAAHCFCPFDTAALDGTNWAFWTPQMGTAPGITGKGVEYTIFDKTNCDDGISGATDANRDLAVLFLSQNCTRSRARGRRESGAIRVREGSGETAVATAV
jgi:hypothetical protein